MLHRGTDRQDRLKMFLRLHSVLPQLEQSSYFDVAREVRAVVDQFQTAGDLMPKIEAWSFVPHPNVMRAFSMKTHPMERYIVTIDALQSKIYFPVKDFLDKQQANVRSYYTGGWADFLCDVQLDKEKLIEFTDGLRRVMQDAGVADYLREDETPISVFSVTKPLILCGAPLSEVAQPSAAAIDAVLRERAKFELAFRDYRSPECAALFADRKELLEYLRRLKNAGIIICYRVVLDFSFYSTRDYVPMILSGRGDAPVDRLIEKNKSNSQLLAPVRELLKVTAVEFADATEENVNYIFINQYEYPGERSLWKRAIYEETKVDVNLYTYPLESTLNESPTYLSDLPEVLSAAKRYQYISPALLIGSVRHTLLTNPPPVAIPVDALQAHGVTLGAPGCGKTNSDMVIVTEASKHLPSIVILDSSGSVRGKLGSLPKEFQSSLKMITANAANATDVALNALTSSGHSLVECGPEDLPYVFEQFMLQLQKLPDPTVGNTARQVHGLLLVEESHIALGHSDDQTRRNTKLLLEALSMAWRKGWCIWLSTQSVFTLGNDPAASIGVLRQLGNRLLLRIKDRTELNALTKLFVEEGHAQDVTEPRLTELLSCKSGDGILRSINPLLEERLLPLLPICVTLFKDK